MKNSFYLFFFILFKKNDGVSFYLFIGFLYSFLVYFTTNFPYYFHKTAERPACEHVTGGCDICFPGSEKCFVTVGCDTYFLESEEYLFKCSSSWASSPKGGQERTFNRATGKDTVSS